MMVRSLVVGLTVLVAGVPALAAQSAPEPAAEHRWLGTWQGTFESDHAPSGPMQLIVARDSVWRVTVQVMVAGEEYRREGYQVRLADGMLTWEQEVMGAACRGSARIEEDVMVGQTDCGGGGLQYRLARVRLPAAPMGGR